MKSVGCCNRKIFALGTGLVFLGILMPAFITVENVKLYETLSKAIYQDQEIYLLLGALKLISMNTIRAYPHYLGVFFIVESFDSMQTRRKIAVTIATVCLVIPLVYVLIHHIYHIRYDFGIPAITMILMVIVLGKIDFRFIRLTRKTLVVALLIASVQFLDMMPLLWELPFGRGESSMDIKLVSQFLSADPFLQGMTTLFFALFLFMAVLLLMLIVDENNIRYMSEQKEINERMLVETRMRELENRTYMELRYLVHDLKSPLASLQTLIGVVELECGDNQRQTEFIRRAEKSADQMSRMISEILYKEKQSVVTTQEILASTMSQISVADYAEQIYVENQEKEVKIHVNQIRFSRVLVNVLENAAHALPRCGGKIMIKTKCIQRDKRQFVCFTIQDNGRGISKEQLEQIWEIGYSSRNSHGLGLGFVKQVVAQSDGEVQINSEEGVGTTVKILLPVYEGENDE